MCNAAKINKKWVSLFEFVSSYHMPLKVRENTWEPNFQISVWRRATREYSVHFLKRALLSLPMNSVISVVNCAPHF